MTCSVLIVYDRPKDFAPMLAAAFPTVSFDYATRPQEIQPTLERCRPEVVFSIKHTDFPGNTHRPIVSFASVRWVQVGGSGYEHLLPWDSARLTVTNGAGVLSRYLAETVTGAMLALNGGLFAYFDRQRQKIWQPNPFRPLCEQTLLVVGLGSIGGQVAANAKALGMHVMGIRRRPEPHPAADEVFGPDRLEEVVGRADVVSLHVRLTDQTRHLFDRRVLAAMQPEALLINTSRGPVVDQTALAEALGSGHLKGAYLDVFDREPLPADSPLWHLPNVILTPHAADCVTDWPRKFADFFGANLRRWIDGRPLLNLVVP